MSQELLLTEWRAESCAGPVAVLVNAASLTHAGADAVLAFAGTLGPVAVRRVYCDVTRQHEWCGDGRFNPIHTMHRGENQASTYLMMDAFVMAEQGRAASFVIAEDNPDFAPVAQRLRDLGCAVHGLGFEAAPAVVGLPGATADGVTQSRAS